MYEGFYLRKELLDEKAKETRMARIEELENEIFERAAGVVNAYLSFAEVTPQQQEPPPEWVEKYGPEGAKQRLAIAKAGWLPASVAPAGAKLAVQAQIGISRGRAYKQARLTQNNLNVKISLPAPTSTDHPGPTVYEVRDLET
jgi:hypothetical protein